MKNLELTQMENMHGGFDGGDIICGLSNACLGGIALLAIEASCIINEMA